MRKHFVFAVFTAMFTAFTISKLSTTSASVADTDIPSADSVSFRTDLDLTPTEDGFVLVEPDSPFISLRSTTGTHVSSKVVSKKTTKRKFLKTLTGYVKGPGTVHFAKGRSFSGSSSVSAGSGSISFTFSGTSSASYSFKVPSKKYGAVGYYADVTATKYLVKYYNNATNRLVSSKYYTSCTLSHRYYGLHLR